jgi:hypothetical protein
MPAPVDASTSASSIVDNYDQDLDRLMNAIAAYTNRENLGTMVSSDSSGTVLGTYTCGEDNVYTYRGRNYTAFNGTEIVDGGQYAMDDSSGRASPTRLAVEVNGQPMNAALIEKPGFQLTAATVTNDITTNIGFTGKVVADKNNWVKMINQAVR